jgi:rubrerythrin
MKSEKVKQTGQCIIELRVSLDRSIEQQRESSQEWTSGICPNCGYTQADIDQEGILWCPACGYSKKGCYT